MSQVPDLTIAIRAARRAGALALRFFEQRDTLRVEEKSPADLVSNADTEVQREILQHLRRAYPKFAIVAEEGGDRAAALPAGPCWIIDPIDGTTNFVHGFPHFAISIALAEAGEVLAGLVYHPARDELYTAERGRGAFLNGQRLRVSRVRALGQALLVTGFPLRQRERLDAYLVSFAHLLRQSQEVRRTGSAALDLAYVAAGRCDGFWELGLAPWDVAAGALLVREAGGFVSDLRGHPDFLVNGDVVAANPAIHQELLAQMRACNLA